ncbi:MAG: septal ring lytic transglycosylase RlpA family protein [Bacteroidaceae bacterium]|nr:septal ring lytic transglycosylase RlpA family protein [Bacteroidaceae bacterium]
MKKLLLFLFIALFCAPIGAQTQVGESSLHENNQVPPAPKQKDVSSASEQSEILIKGNASYYADKFHGRRTASGEIYNKDSMTCAHLKFPFGTLLKVRNPLNDRTVIVRVTDRGPYSKRFILDLSRAAARELDIIRAGFTMVEITPIHPYDIPYRAEEDSLLEIPELDLQYTPAATYPEPIWQRDSTQTSPQDKQP